MKKSVLILRIAAVFVAVSVGMTHLAADEPADATGWEAATGRIADPAIKTETALRAEPAAPATPATIGNQTSLKQYRIEPPDVLSVKVAQVFASPGEAANAVDPNILSRGINREHLVQPDGTIDLGSLKNLDVSGKTVQDAARAIERELAATWPDARFTARVNVAKFNSKRVYIVLEYGGGESGDVLLHKIAGDPATTESTVWSVLSQVTWPKPIKFANAAISVRRPTVHVDDDLTVNSDEKILRVTWNAKTGRPTEDSNYALLPGDRIDVKLPGPAPESLAAVSVARAAPASPPVATPATQWYSPAETFPPAPPSWPTPTLAAVPAPTLAPQYAPTPALPNVAPRPLPTAIAPPLFGPGPIGENRYWMRETRLPDVAANGDIAVRPQSGRTADPQQVLCKVQIIEDLKGNLDAFDPVCDGGFIVGDSDSLLGAVRILANNDLIRTLAEPNVVCTVGRPLQFEVQNAVAADAADQVTIQYTNLGITAQERAGKLRLALRMRVGQGDQLRLLQTNADLQDGQTLITKADAADKMPVYVVVTPERIQPAPVVALAIPPIYAPAARYSDWNGEMGPSPAAAPHAFPELSTITGPELAPTAFFGPALAVPSFPSGPPELFPPGNAATPRPAMMPMPYRAPAESIRATSAGSKPSTVKFEIAVVEDVSDSMAEFMPPSGEAPFLMADTQTMQAALRVLDKQNLIRRVSNSQMMAASGEQATLEIGTEATDEDLRWQGLKLEATAQEMGGGLDIDFQLGQQDPAGDFRVSLDLIVAHGQSVVMKTGRPTTRKVADVAANAGDTNEKSKAEHPIYIVLTPELVR